MSAAARAGGGLRRRFGRVLAGLLAFVGAWVLSGCDPARDDVGATPIAVRRAVVTLAASTPTARAVTPTPMPAAVVVTPTPAAVQATAATVATRAVTPTPTVDPSTAESTAARRRAIAEARLRQSQNTVAYVEVDPPRLGQDFDTCGSNQFLWGPRHDYDFLAWRPDGSELYFSDGGDVRGVSADGWRLWRIARAWPPEAEGKLRSETGWTSFAVAPGGFQLVYVACVVESPDTVRPPDFPPHIELRGPEDTDTGFHYDLFRVTDDGTDAERLTVSGAIEFYPAWSPDGRRIAFLTDSGRYDPDRFYWHPGLGLNTMAPDGTDVRQVLGREVEVLHQPPQWSPDSRHLAVVLYRTDASPELRGRSLHLVGADGGEPRQLARSVVSGPSWSPDGQWLAYARATADLEVALYIVGADGTDNRRITDIPSWRAPRIPNVDVLHSLAWIDTVAWSPDGTRILVSSDPGSAAFVITLATGEITELRLDSVRAAAWSPDGSRIGLIGGWYGEASPQIAATMAADGTDLRVLAEHEDPSGAGSRLLAGRGRYVPGPEDEAACRIGGAVPDSDVNEGLVEECVDLIRVHKSLVGGEALNWRPELPMAEWEGVVLGGEPPYVGVRELDLGGHGLRGALHEAIPWKPSLRVLILRDNSLDGWIPDESLKLWDLEVIDLSNNQLTGPIPLRMGELDQLRILDLSSNQLSGEIPAELADLPNLQEIALAGNQFTGCVPLGLPLRDRDDLDLPTCEPAT